MPPDPQISMHVLLNSALPIASWPLSQWLTPSLLLASKDNRDRMYSVAAFIKYVIAMYSR